MRVYNTLSREKEKFETREPGKVFMYVCGPTVYNYIHIGNARTFLSFDVIRRYLAWRGYEVVFVQNITDVDDKIINKANEEGRSAAEVAAEYTEAFISEMRALGVEDPTYRPKATETIPDMIAMIEQLIEAGHAYPVDGDVYFSVRSFPGYGKLSGRDIDEMRSGARVDVDDRKTDPLDFALWKAAKPGEPHWPSPWGRGPPGMAHRVQRDVATIFSATTFDIHGGASDLIFPHHENELAQSEAALGRALRALLAARWVAADQPGEDEQVARQLHAAQGPARRVRHPSHPLVHASDALPLAARLLHATAGRGATPTSASPISSTT